MGKMLKLGIVLMLYSLVAGALLAMVYLKTSPVIEANRQSASSGVMAELLPDMQGGFEQHGEEGGFVYWTAYPKAGATEPGGYIVIARGKGYSSVIETMVAVSPDLRIVSANVLYQQETPGLGDQVQNPSFIGQFAGLSGDEVAFTKDGGAVDAISGATISSTAVTTSIATAVKNLVAALSGEEVVVEEPVAFEETPPEPTPLHLPSEGELADVLGGASETSEAHGLDTEFPYWTRGGSAAFIARGQGFQSQVQILVGVNAAKAITGLTVLYQNETPGYGTRIVDEPAFLRQFVGVASPDQAAFVADGGRIDAMSGATITSKAVSGAISAGLTDLADALAGKEFAAAAVASISPEARLAPAPEPEPEPAIPADEQAAAVLPGMKAYVAAGEGTSFLYWIGYTDREGGTVGGYAFIARGKGFASTVETLVGVDPKGKILNVQVISQNETPGYGTRIVDEPDFMRQFPGKSDPGSVKLKADGGTIDALTGATITSRTVSTSIAEGLTAMGRVIRGEESEAVPAAAPAAAPTAPAAAPGPESSFPEVLPDMRGYQPTEKNGFSYWTGYLMPGNIMEGGYVFIARGGGFASIVETFVGVDTAGKITGVKILSQDETPGYGTRAMSEPEFAAHFVGKTASDNLLLTADGGSVDALTGATITSRAVAKSVAAGLDSLMQAVSGAPAVSRQSSAAPSFTLPADAPDNEKLAWMLPGMEGGYAVRGLDDGFFYWIGWKDAAKTEVGGYLYLARGKGFASEIVTLVAVDTAGAITDMDILSQNETPGYGDKIVAIPEGKQAPEFPLQFIGRSDPARIALTADGGVIDAITGATISSRAVTSSVQAGLERLSAVIR